MSRCPVVCHAVAALAVAALLAGCDGDPTPAADTMAAVDTGRDTAASASCLPISPNVRGSLVGQRAAAQEDARRVRVREDGITDANRRREGSATITIVPTCGSHTFREGDLARGQFVARLTIDGTAERFSRAANDTVYWWVYLDVSSGRPVYRSQFLSIKGTADERGASLKGGEFVIRCKPAGERPKVEGAAWEARHGPEACPVDRQGFLPMQAISADSSTGQGGGDAPWYACWMGCCQAASIADE